MNSNSLTDKVSTVDREAADWLAHLYSGEATEKEKRKFSEWLRQSSANAAAFNAVKQSWNDSIVCVELDDFGLDHRFNEEVPTAVSTHHDKYAARGWIHGIAAAAALCLILITGMLLYTHADQPAPIVTQYATSTGETRTFVLKDGSAITLSGGSNINAEFTPTHRSVELVSGRAFFEVQHESGRPFIVNAEKTRLRVVGTRFDVNKAHNVVAVAVERGVVRVGQTVDGDRIRGGVTLRAGQRVSADATNGKMAAIETFDPSRVAPWRFGMLVFRNQRLDDVLAEVNRYRERKIVIADPRLADFPITMALPVGKTDGLLFGLESSGVIKVETSSGGISLKNR